MADSTCEFCGLSVRSEPLPNRHTVLQRSRCGCMGAYLVEAGELAMVQEELASDMLKRRKISRLLCERRLMGLPAPLLVFVRENLRSASAVPNTVPLFVDAWLDEKWPVTVNEKIDRTFINLARLSRYGGDWVSVTPSTVFAVSADEQDFVLQSLRERRHLIGRDDSAGAGIVITKGQLTPSGWAAYYASNVVKSDRRNPVFVAMWFGGSRGVRKGESHEIERCRQSTKRQFGPLSEQPVTTSKERIPRNTTTTYMDRIRADIRRAPFLVAELNGQNLGVYYEAGFAAGIGIPVIPCCPELPIRNRPGSIRTISGGRACCISASTVSDGSVGRTQAWVAMANAMSSP